MDSAASHRKQRFLQSGHFVGLTLLAAFSGPVTFAQVTDWLEFSEITQRVEAGGGRP